jgi:hypothetical protein
MRALLSLRKPGFPAPGAAALRDPAWLARMAVYIPLLLIPLIAIPISQTERASTVDLAGLPILLLLLARRRIPRSMLLLFLASFLVSALLLLPLAPSPVLETLRIYRLAAIYAPFVLALTLPWDVEDAERALRIVWWAGLAGILLGFSIFWSEDTVRERQQRLWIGESSEAVLRAGGLLGNSGGFSHLITGWAMAALLLRWFALGRLNLVQVAITVTLLLYGILATASRASLLQVGAALLFGFFLIVRADPRSVLRSVFLLVVAGLLASAAAAALLVVMEPEFVDAVLTRFGLAGDPSLLLQSRRYEHWYDLIRITQWNPFGIGYKRTTELTGLQVDNSYLRIFLELGLLGIFSYLAMWALVLVGLLRRGADTLVNRYRAATAALVMGELARMAFSDTFTMFLSAPTFLVLVAIALRLRDRESVDGVR